MIDSVERTDLCRQLGNLLATGDLPVSHEKIGQRLLGQLTSNVSVVLAGPETAAKEYLGDVLSEAELPQTSFSCIPWGTVMDFTQVDVCIWCTASYDLEEATQWQIAPDRLKDHSFLAIFTGIGIVDQRLHNAMAARLNDIAAEEFYSLLEITFGHRASPTPPQAVAVLLSELSQMVRMGLAADMDNALLFLKTHRSKAGTNTAEIPEVVPPTSVPPATQKTNEPACIDPLAETAVYEKALLTMRGHLAELEPLMHAQEEGEIDQILDLCKTASEAVADVFSESDLHAPSFSALKDETLSAADTILLMSLEGGVAPAVSAVTTVLQLRREMEGQLGL